MLPSSFGQNSLQSTFLQIDALIGVNGETSKYRTIIAVVTNFFTEIAPEGSVIGTCYLFEGVYLLNQGEPGGD